jgi:hypothetical protein
MATYKVIFNNKRYNIENEKLDNAVLDLASYFSTTINGSGETIYFNNTTYNIDSNKITPAKQDFVNYLGTIAGEGMSVVIDDIKYNLDKNKLINTATRFAEILEFLELSPGFLTIDENAILTIEENEAGGQTAILN